MLIPLLDFGANKNYHGQAQMAMFSLDVQMYDENV